MAKRTGKGKVGRPAIEFDLEIVEGLGRIGATAAEMAHVLPAARSTIEHRMSDPASDFYKAYRKGQALLKASLRRKQIAVAMTGSVAMLIWLGKQHLGQQEKIIETRRGMDQLFDDELPTPVKKFETAEEAREFLRRMGVHG